MANSPSKRVRECVWLVSADTLRRIHDVSGWFIRSVVGWLTDGGVSRV